MNIFDWLFKRRKRPEHTADFGQATPAVKLSDLLKSERDLLNVLIGGWPTKITNAEDAKLVQERWTRAVTYAQLHIQKYPKSTEDQVVLADLLRMGHNMDARGAGEDSHRILTEVLKSEPNNSEAHYVLACLYVTSNAEAAHLAEKHFLASLLYAKDTRLCLKTPRGRNLSDFCSDRGANFMRYPQEITPEVRNEEPDKKRQIATAGSFQTEPSVNPNVYQGLGFACVYQKRTFEAITYFEKFLTLVPESLPTKEIVTKLKAGAEAQVIFKPLESTS